MSSYEQIPVKYGVEAFRRRRPYQQNPITLAELERECHVYEDEEPRDSMYRASSFLVQEWWKDQAKLADAISVILLTWNANFYRFGGGLIFKELEAFLHANWSLIEACRKRQLLTFDEKDHSLVFELFSQLSTAVRLAANERESPVRLGQGASYTCSGSISNLGSIYSTSIQLHVQKRCCWCCIYCIL